MLTRILHTSDGAEGNGTTTSAATTTTTTTPASTPARSDGFEALAAKHSNDGIGLARDLWSQLQDANKRISEITGKVPGEGSLVLTADQAKAWSKYASLGKPDELKTLLDEGNVAKGEVSKYQRRETIRTVAEVAGFDPEVLATLAGDLEFEVVEESVKGKPTKVVKVKDGDASTPIEKFAESRWAKFLPSLRPAARTLPLGTPQSRPTTTTSPSNRPVNTSDPDGGPVRDRILPIGGW